MPAIPDEDFLPEDEAPVANPTSRGEIENFVIDHPLAALIGAFIGGVLISKLGLI